MPEGTSLTKESDMDKKERNERLVEIMNRKDEILIKREEALKIIESLADELQGLDDELLELTGAPKFIPERNGSGRKCKLCGETGHISREGKCRNFPNGKSEAA